MTGRSLWLATFWFVLSSPAVAESVDFLTHEPMRPLPGASMRPMSDGPSRFVDSNRGADASDGSRERPWKSLSHAISQLSPGDTLYLRGGTYYEHVTVNVAATREKPVTVRSFPGELAILDGGLPEFFESSGTAWEPVKDGAPGEYRSVRAYPDLGGRAGSTNVLGNFGDSMVPLHGYRYLSDLRSDNEYFSKLDAGKTEAGGSIYCGPGIYYDIDSGRIHVRLAHTQQSALGDDNYSGETDPRRIPLVIAGTAAGSALTLNGAANVSFQDIVVRGARAATVSVINSANIEFDGVTMYGGASPISVRDTAGLQLWNCACRGIAAPWTFRGSLKYRAIEARLFSASGWAPTGRDSRDFEIGYSEFTDCVDGVFIGNVRRVLFHHNLLDNISDDGIYLTATTAYDGTTPGGSVHIYQNVLRRCLTTFAFGVGHGRQKMTPTGRQTGAGVFICRNVIDLRRPVYYAQPEAGAPELTSAGRICGDHGGPLWEPMTIAHNTILLRETPWRNYYAGGLGGHMAGGSSRRVFNNMILHGEGVPGHVLPPVVLPPGSAQASSVEGSKGIDPLDALIDGKAPPPPVERKPAPLPVDFEADGNLHWSYGTAATAEQLFGRFRDSTDFKNSRKLYTAGWTAHDTVQNPGLVGYSPDWRKPLDLQLTEVSSARDAGVPTAASPELASWFDPLRDGDAGQPDIGAIHLAAKLWRVGVQGRLNAFGQSPNRPLSKITKGEFPQIDPPPSLRSPSQVVIVQGYPAFDAPLLEFALRKRGVPFESLEKTWLDPAEYSNFGTVVIVGSLPRAQIEPNRYTPADLKHVDEFLRSGGTLMLMRGNQWVFREPDGQHFLAEITGSSVRRASGFEILDPEHKWLSHLDPKAQHAWVSPGHAEAIRASRGEVVIGNDAGLTTLYRVRVGKGQLIYVGWEIAASLPHGRKPSTVADETAYEEQMQILQNIVDDVISHRPAE